MTSESECLDALRDATEKLGKSPTKAEYEELGLRPASATIIRTVGGWNEAKRRAGLETEPSTGSRVTPKPESVNLPDGMEWEALTVDQRWHYRNVEWNTERTLKRRAELRSWVNDYKQSKGCARCGETDPACLDFHHRDPDAKEMAVGKMITHGYGKAKLRDEMAKCNVLCANCHRRAHYDRPGQNDEQLRVWLHEYKQSTEGCRHCDEADPACLDFHHDGEKRATVARLVADGYDRETVQAEIDRCVPLCANCHRKAHFNRPDPGE